jgi:hypothetical protein
MKQEACKLLQLLLNINEIYCVKYAGNIAGKDI